MNKKNSNNENLKKVSGGAGIKDSGNWKIICRGCFKILEDGLISDKAARDHIKWWHDENTKCPWCQSTDFEPIEEL